MRFLSCGRLTHRTPKSYLDLITMYLTMLDEKQTEYKVVQDRMKVGVQKLNETNAVVDSLKDELTELQPVLVEKSKETEVLLKKVAVDQAEADKVEERAAEVKEIADDAQRDLDVAMPALNNALKALDSLDKKDITEIKSFAKPPPAVQTVMEAVCILLGETPDWDTSKRVLGWSDFMTKLQEYDKDNISAKILKKIRGKYTNDPMMAVENVGRVSVAAKSLCMWVHAMDVYSKVAKEVGPKKEKVAKLSEELGVVKDALAEKQAELQGVKDKVAGLQKLLKETLDQKQGLQDQSDLTEARLVRAEKLTSGLSEEGARWRQTVEEIGVKLTKLIGDVMISSGCISYYGAFTGAYRQELVDDWIKTASLYQIPRSEDCSLLQTLGDPVRVREWQICGLPTDAVSVDSAVLVARGQRWPLMIDPQAQANRWIKNKEAANNLECIKMNNPNLLRSLENAIRVGRPLLVEDLQEHIDPSLEPVLQKATFQQGGRTLIHLGDSDIDYDPNFRFYMTTKMPNPHYLPEVCIKVTVINFTVTLPGLTDQLLGDVVKAERPDVEQRKNKLVVSMAADAKQLKDIESKILKMLSESKGNILDDEVLINTLSDAKTTANIINERVVESKKTQKAIDEARASYKPVAVRGAILYFVVADLAFIDPMYQYSLQYFSGLFTLCLAEAPADPDLAGRLKSMMDYQTNKIFSTICRGLFETHKALFAALICIQILREREEITKSELTLLLRGAGVVDRSQQRPCPDSSRLIETQWDMVCSFETEVWTDGGDGLVDSGDERQPFLGLVDSMCDDWDAWLGWANCTDPLHTPFPAPFEARLNLFQRMMLLKVFREEKLLHAMTHFVDVNLGRRFIEFPPIPMEEIYQATDCATPLIFVLSQGADPTNMLVRFAKDMKYQDRLSVISLGQGQGPHAERLIKQASEKTGDWVLLQNCHLAQSWMGKLEDIVFQLGENKETIKKSFRLYLTSFPADFFPVAVLQTAVKLTNEPPKGVRANLIRSFDGLVAASEWETCLKPRPWKKLLVGLAFFHALVQERRKFGPLGWNIRYEFNDTDLETSVTVLKRFLDQQPVVPWDALEYVTGHINYGGRVTDDWDRRCLMGMLRRFVRPEVLDEGFTFSSSGKYYAPDEGTHADVVKYIAALPMAERPELFGMDDNADITCQKQESVYQISTILSLQPRDSGGGDGKSSDDIVLDLAAEISDQVPEILDVEKAGPKTFVRLETGLLSSLDTVLSQEIVKFNRLIDRLATTIVDVSKAIKGLVVMSLDLDKMYTSFLNNAVPELWSSVGFASRKSLLSWVKDMLFRVKFCRNWLVEGQPSCFAFQAFFFPQGFMTGTLQTHARKYQLAIDTLNFSFRVYEEEDVSKIEAPEDGVVVTGMWLEGAYWSRETKCLADSLRGEIYTPVPPIHFRPEVNCTCGDGEYECPVYKTSIRQGALSTTGISTNFVVAVNLPTTVESDNWVMNGTACLLNLDT